MGKAISELDRKVEAGDATPEGMVCMSMKFSRAQAGFARRMHLSKSVMADVADFFSSLSDEKNEEEEV